LKYHLTQEFNCIFKLFGLILIEPNKYNIFLEHHLMMINERGTTEMTCTAENKKLVLIAGASAGIGRAYFDHYIRQKNIICYGIGRKSSNNTHHIKADLLDKEHAESVAKNLNPENVSSILYMHLIGLDKFEPEGIPEIDEDKDGIDDRVLASNFETFKNLAVPLIAKAQEYNKRIHIVNVGSISDIYKVMFWQSFSRAKDEIRRFMKEQPPELFSTFLNVSSVATDFEKYGRPYADTRYWLRPEELVSRSLSIIERDTTASRYIEVDIFNPDPNFRSDYFTNLPELLKKWKHDMGIKEDEEVPRGLRI